jgi:hypothetical protein
MRSDKPGNSSLAMDLNTEQTGWLVEFLGGPWDRQTGFFIGLTW